MVASRPRERGQVIQATDLFKFVSPEALDHFIQVLLNTLLNVDDACPPAHPAWPGFASQIDRLRSDGYVHVLLLSDLEERLERNHLI
jgi:hypothetical protein